MKKESKMKYKLIKTKTKIKIMTTSIKYTDQLKFILVNHLFL